VCDGGGLTDVVMSGRLPESLALPHDGADVRRVPWQTSSLCNECW
jgi:hypothetical protein